MSVFNHPNLPRAWIRGPLGPADAPIQRSHSLSMDLHSHRDLNSKISDATLKPSSGTFGTLVGERDPCWSCTCSATKFTIEEKTKMVEKLAIDEDLD
ncbi:hypothetical protein GWK47_053647 [Chionoecetes opilio]|uniref:Uncharacterized protein n=1 Tax=Chionoecetes opilio TaxID=41210 RepID=A0A8J4Y5V3_CHIOP|nr:hypothetical protein GWK47_053647 [Chionoecetes opilio]